MCVCVAKVLTLCLSPFKLSSVEHIHIHSLSYTKRGLECKTHTQKYIRVHLVFPTHIDMTYSTCLSMAVEIHIHKRAQDWHWVNTATARWTEAVRQLRKMSHPQHFSHSKEHEIKH